MKAASHKRTKFLCKYMVQIIGELVSYFVLELLCILKNTFMFQKIGSVLFVLLDSVRASSIALC